MDDIYEEMWERNVLDLKTYGNLYHPSWETGKKCLAFVARGDWQICTVDLSHILERIKINVIDSFVEPRLHHTFFVVNDFSQDDVVTDKEVNEMLTYVSQLDIPKYKITFDKLIPVKTGICLVGHVDDCALTINGAREKMRYRYGHGERYKLNIFHATIVRWTRPLRGREIDYVIRVCSEWNGVLATLEVNELQLLKASWLLQERDVECLGTVGLHGKKLSIPNYKGANE